MAIRNPFSAAAKRSPEPASAYHEASSVPVAPAPGAGGTAPPAGAPAGGLPSRSRDDGRSIDLEKRREQLTARVAELQWDLGGLVYEMATRDRIKVDVIVRRAALLQDADAELGEVERILRMEHTGSAGTCANCGAPHSGGAVFCWQCGQSLLEQVPSHAIGGDTSPPARG
jgi:hypothetical protein